MLKKYLIVFFIFSVLLLMFGCDGNHTTMESKKLIDSASINKIEGYYVGKGNLNGQNIYIIQPKKDNQLCENIEIYSCNCEIINVDEEKNTKVDVYERVFKTKDENNKVSRKSDLYYKIYIPEDFVIDLGELKK